MADITSLLALACAGDHPAEEALYARVYDELRVLARHHLHREGPVTQLDAPGLVGEAYLRMAAREGLSFENRHRFFAYASRVMRSVIIDHVREKRAERRGGGAPGVTLTTSIKDEALSGPDLLALDEAMRSLARLDARCHDVFEMHFFAGMSVDDIAQAMAVSPATVKRDVRKARAFLLEALDG